MKINKLLLFLMVLIVFSSLSHAFGETKDYDPNTKTITIKSWFGMPLISKDIAKLTLTENTDQCLTDCYSKIDIVLYENSKLAEKIKFKKSKGEANNIIYTFYSIETIEDIVKVPIVKTCERALAVNETDPTYLCEQGYNNITQKRTVKKEINPKTDFIGSEEGSHYQILLTGNKKPTENVDWVITLKGLDLDEFAWWNSNWISKISLTNVNNTVAYPIRDYPFNFTVNGSFLIANGMDATGKDFRVIQNGSEVTFVNMTSFNRDDVNIIAKINLAENYNDTSFEIYFDNPSAVFQYNNLSDVYTAVSPFRSQDWFNIGYGSTLVTAANLSFNGIVGSSNRPDILCNSNNLSTGFVAEYSGEMGATNPPMIYFYFNETGQANDLTDNRTYAIYYDKNSAANQPMLAKAGNYSSAFVLPIQQFTTNWTTAQAAPLGSSSFFRMEIKKPVFTELVVNFSRKVFGGNSWESTSNSSSGLLDYNINDRTIFATSGSVCFYDNTNNNLNVSSLKLYQKIDPYTAEDIPYSISYSLLHAEGITLNVYQPINNSLFNETLTRFAVNITPTNTTLNNATIYIYQKSGSDYYLYTQNISTLSGNTAYIYNFTFPLVDGLNWSWNMTSCGVGDSTTIRCTSTNELAFSIDSSTPSLELFSPLTNLSTLNIPVNVTLNYTASGASLSSCWYNTNENSTNTYFTCNTSQNILFQNGSQKTIYYFANNSFGSIASSSKNFFLNYIRPTIRYNAVRVEGENNLFNFSVIADSVYQANVTLDYNNTNYQMILNANNATAASFYRNFSAPFVETDTNFSFNFSYYVNGNYYNTTSYGQLIQAIPNLTVAASCTPAALTFNLKDEENLSDLLGDYEYNFYYGLSNSSLVNVYGKINNTNGFSVCINQTISPIWYIGQGEIFYRSSGYVDRRYYIFDNTQITNVTRNIILYDLLSTSQTSFQLVVESNTLSPYNNIFTQLIRWYPDLNEYKIVDMGLTDETGSTIIHVKEEDVDYRIGVYNRNGSLIYLAAPIRMVCTTAPCTYTLVISPEDIDYTSFLKVSYTFTFNETTGIWLFSYNDNSGNTDTMNLSVYKFTGSSRVLICNNLVTGAVGAATCNTSGFTGDLIGIVTRSASPEIPIAQKLVSIITSPFKSTFGLWIFALAGIAIFLVLAMVSPTLAIVGGVLALLPAYYFGAVNLLIVGGVAIMGGIVAHFLKRVG